MGSMFLTHSHIPTRVQVFLQGLLFGLAVALRGASRTSPRAVEPTVRALGRWFVGVVHPTRLENSGPLKGMVLRGKGKQPGQSRSAKTQNFLERPKAAICQSQEMWTKLRIGQTIFCIRRVWLLGPTHGSEQLRNAHR